MSDTRFTILGIALIFSGFVILGIFGTQYFVSSIEAEEFDECFEYYEDSEPIKVDCNVKLQQKFLFFSVIIIIICIGIIALLKGVKGSWDQDVKPEDMVGPGGPSKSNSDKLD